MRKIKNLGIMLDCSRDAVYTVDTLKKYIEIMSKMGYNTLQLYTEDTYEIDEPYFGYLRGRYSIEELNAIDKYASAHNIELVPCIQTLAHLGGYLRWTPDICDCNDILLCEDERTYQLIDKMFDSCAKAFKSRRINIGMDEAHMVGLGNYLDKHGYKNRFEILSKHLGRVCEIADKYGFKPMMWSDMFFRLANNGEYYDENTEMDKAVIDMVPENLKLVYWDYHSIDKGHYDRMLSAHKQFKNEIGFAGGAWSWTGFVPNNAWSIEANKSAIRSCVEHGVDEVLITNWKDDGAECSLFSTLPVMFVTAQMTQGEFDMSVIKQGFYEMFDIDYDDFILVDEINNLDGEIKEANPDKYMLYNDPFLGVMDDTVDMSKAEHFAEIEAKLDSVNAGEFHYIFETLSALAAVLKHKYPLGVMTRDAYKSGERNALRDLCEEYALAQKAVERLFEAFRVQWNREGKPYGFEKHCARLGGLSLRLGECRRRIEEYLDGKTDSIPELEEQILPFYRDHPHGKTLRWNRYISITRLKPFHDS